MLKFQVVGSLVVAGLGLAGGLSGCGERPDAGGDSVGVVRSAAFINGDFESNAIGVNPTGWTISTFSNPGITDNRPAAQTLASLNLAAGGYSASHIVGGATESQSDPDLGGGASSLSEVRHEIGSGQLPECGQSWKQPECEPADPDDDHHQQ